MSDQHHVSRRIGMSRRELMRRGAIVGGTLLWTVPVLSTVSKAHFGAAHTPATGCCECTKPKIGSQVSPFCPQPQSAADTPSKCAAACRAADYTSSQYHTAPGNDHTGPGFADTIACVDGTGCVGTDHPHP